MKTPWTVSYSDGSANTYLIAHRRARKPAQFSYDPVKPEESSSGMYSGGDPASGPLTTNDVAQLWRLLRDVHSDKTNHTQRRAKGTASISWKTSEGRERFVVKHGAIEALDGFLLSLRQRVAKKHGHSPTK